MPEFKGIKLSQDPDVCRLYDVNKITVVRESGTILVNEAGTVAAGSVNGGGNSGFQVLNIVAQFDPRKIVLVGYDMRTDFGTHWHGRHPAGLNNPRDTHMVHWRRALNESAERLKALDINVINASKISTITAFPVMDLKDALRC